MIEKREKEWQELEEKAMLLLENPQTESKDALLKFYRPVLRLWTYPSFEPCRVWVFSEPDFRTISPKKFKIIRALWNQNDDYKRLSDPLEGLKKGFVTDPVISVSSVDIDKEVFEEIYNGLKGIRFPAFSSDGTIGVDGVRYGIESGRFSSGTSVSWWSIYPTEWQPLVDWFERTTEFLDELFRN